jgi:RNase adaptor protein for sRNA GlmZ degradation
MDNQEESQMEQINLTSSLVGLGKGTVKSYSLWRVVHPLDKNGNVNQSIKLEVDKLEDFNDIDVTELLKECEKINQKNNLNKRLGIFDEKDNISYLYIINKESKMETTINPKVKLSLLKRVINYFKF